MLAVSLLDRPIKTCWHLQCPICTVIMTATVPEQPGRCGSGGKKTFCQEHETISPKRHPLFWHMVTTQLGGLREVSSAWAILKSAQKPINEHTPDVHKPKAWLTSELPWLKANFFHNIYIYLI